MKNVLRNATPWTLALAVAAMVATASAQQTTPATPAAPSPATPAPTTVAPSTPAQTPAPAPSTTTPAAPSAQAPAAPPANATVDHYVVGTAVPVARPGTTLLNLTLDQAMDMALENNLDLKAARMNPPGVDYQLAAARASFIPQVTGTYGYNDSTTANTSTLEGRNTLTQVQQTYNAGLSQTMPWYGGRLQVGFNNTRLTTNSTTQLFDPNYNARLNFSYTQPLLQGFKIDNTRNQLRTLSVQRQIADIQLLTTIENTKASVRTAYWNLREAIEQIEIQQRALDLAQRLFEDNKTKVEIGTLAPIDTVTPEAQVASAEQSLLNAQIIWRTAEINLQQLLATGPDDPIYQRTINPTERPQLSVQTVNIPDAVKTALAQRTDLVQAKRNIEVSQLNLEVTRDLTKPQLDLQAAYNVQGQGGRELDRDTNLRTDGGYGDAFNQIIGFDLPTWTATFNFTYPLFMRAAKANYARAELQLQQSQAQLKASELAVSSSVTSAGLAVENSYKQYQAAQKNREAQERNAEAEQTRFDVGMSTNYNVVQAQNALTQARLTELQALISYLNAVAEFDRVQRVGGTGGGGGGTFAGGQ
ncbi:MAG TPA: TolC family protein [Vicinamibacterales bacterium]|jgi:outer membrane protein TolC|nr:TolC family protein [Vicinamibacterales bacterium]